MAEHDVVPTAEPVESEAVNAMLGDDDEWRALTKPDHPDHDEAVAKLRSLHDTGTTATASTDAGKADDSVLPREQLVEAEKAGDAEYEESVAELRGYFGEKWQEKVDSAKFAITKVFSREMLDKLVENGQGNSVQMITLFAELAERDKNFPCIEMCRKIIAELKTPGAARLRLAEREQDTEWLDAWLYASNPRHEAVVVERRILEEIAASE